LLQELGFGQSQFLEFGDLGSFKEGLRSISVKEIGQAGERLPRVSGGFEPWSFGAASGGMHTNHYDPGQILVGFMLSVIAGAQRFAHTNQLRSDRALHALLGMKRSRVTTRF
jgi:hypothetical protein